MGIDLEKNKKNLDDYIKYVNTQMNFTPEELRNDLTNRGLTEDEVNYVMTFYRPVNKQKMFSHPFSFHGRIRRLEYGLSVIIYYAYYFLISILSRILLYNNLEVAGTLALLTIIPLCWFLLAQGAKRCHDRGNSGWYQLIPFYGLWMLFGDGDKCENDYGFDPKGRNVFSES